MDLPKLTAEEIENTGIFRRKYLSEDLRTKIISITERTLLPFANLRIVGLEQEYSKLASKKELSKKKIGIDYSTVAFLEISRLGLYALGIYHAVSGIIEHLS